MPKSKPFETLRGEKVLPIPLPDSIDRRLSPRQLFKHQSDEINRRKVSMPLSLAMLDHLNQMARDAGTTRTQTIEDAIRLYIETKSSDLEGLSPPTRADDYKVVVRRNEQGRRILKVQHPTEPAPKKTRTETVAKTSPKLTRVRASVDALILTLEDALAYDGREFANEAPPSLRQSGESETLEVLKGILSELKAIRTLLETQNGMQKVRKHPKRLKSIEHYADRFIDGAVTTAGRGAAVLFLLSVNQLLSDFGLMASIPDKIGDFFEN